MKTEESAGKERGKQDRRQNRVPYSGLDRLKGPWRGEKR